MNLFPEKNQIKGIIESLLFIAEKPISIKILNTILNIPEIHLKEAVNELINEYKTRNSGIIIHIEDSYQMVTNPEYNERIKIFKNLNTNNKLFEQTLETLAIIAYKQPITKAEIDKIRGVNLGRLFIYGTTKKFLKLFNISSLNELSGLTEFQKIKAA